METYQEQIEKTSQDLAKLFCHKEPAELMVRWLDQLIALRRDEILAPIKGGFNDEAMRLMDIRARMSELDMLRTTIIQINAENDATQVSDEFTA